MPNVDPQTFKTVGVIVGRDLIGDALIKLPFVHALRNAFPKAEISWITSQGPTAYAGQLREATSAMIDKIYERPAWLPTHGEQPSSLAPWSMAFSIWYPGNKSPEVKPSTPDDAPYFDLLIDTRNRWREAVYAQTIPHGLFLAPAMHFLFSEKRPSYLGSRPPHLVDQLIELVHLASGHRPLSTGALPVPEEDMKKARQILPPGPTYIGLAPGAGDLVKAWPRYKFEKVAFTQAQKGRVPVFILGPQELSWYEELQVTVPSAKFPLQEYDIWGSHAITLDHTIALGRLLDVAVANDSGVGHILAAADCSLISLFGPTSPDKLAPRVTNGLVLRAQDFGSSYMRAISWEAVNEAIENLLAAKPG